MERPPDKFSTGSVGEGGQVSGTSGRQSETLGSSAVKQKTSGDKVRAVKTGD